MIPIDDLSSEQKVFLDMCANGTSFLLNGAQGSGKTEVLSNLESYLWMMGHAKKVIKTASSGMSSRVLGGQTISRLLKLGIYSFGDEELAFKNRDNHIPSDAILIIDEAHNLTDEQVRQIDFSLRICTGKQSSFFGGLQVIFSQDDCQLEPLYGRPWSEGVYRDYLDLIEFDENHRQASDPELLRMLNQLRGAIKNRSAVNLCSWWNDLSLAYIEGSSIEQMVITPDFARAENINAMRQRNLAQGDMEIIVVPEYEGSCEEKYAEQRFCIGTPVIHELNRNGCVNGSLGLVESIDFEQERILVDFDIEGLTWVGRTRLYDLDSIYPSFVDYHPIRQAFALTARRTQGLTLKEGVLCSSFGLENADLRKTYTAVSRYRNRESIRVCA